MEPSCGAARPPSSSPSLPAGFCGALLVVQQRTGRTVSETIWSDAAALAESRSVAAAISVDTAAAADLAVRGLEEYSLLCSSIRPVPTE